MNATLETIMQHVKHLTRQDLVNARLRVSPHGWYKALNAEQKREVIAVQHGHYQPHTLQQLGGKRASATMPELTDDNAKAMDWADGIVKTSRENGYHGAFQLVKGNALVVIYSEKG